MESQKAVKEKEMQSLEKKGYIVRRLLGQGAFSRVYCVEERETGRRAACKISENIKLIKREEEILKKLKHPLFPEYYESWREGEAGFLLMEEVLGENLADLIRRGGKWSVCQIAEMGMELAEGLLYLHESRPAIISRDVKPENIMLRQDGRVKLLDLGCACEPDEDGGTRAGTPGFSAPEQLIEGGEQTCLCDVYGLGRTLQELLWAGEHQDGTARPLAKQSDGRVLREGLSERRERKRLEKPSERRDRRRLEKFLESCVERDPSVRPADMRVVMAALFHLCAPALGAERHGKRDGDFWQKGIICEKNIWKSTWKTS